MGGFSSSAPLEENEYIDNNQLDAQFCVECKNSLEQTRNGLEAAKNELADANSDKQELEYKLESLSQELNTTKQMLEQCNVSKEPFDNSDGSCTSRVFLWVIIALIAGILLGMFIAKRYSYLLDRKLGDILSSDKDNRR